MKYQLQGSSLSTFDSIEEKKTFKKCENIYDITYLDESYIRK